MSINVVRTEQAQSHGNFVVEAPRSSDVISRALRSAFVRQDAMTDDLASLLRQIDAADQPGPDH